MDQAEKRRFDKDTLLEIAKLVMRRFGEDQCMRIAASLSYTCLLSLVPLMAISFAIFAAFPAFEGVQDQLQSYVFENFVPAAGEAVSEYLKSFTEKTGGMTTIGIVGLGVTAVMLLATIEDALNRIFRVRDKRHIVSRLLMFWAVLTLGPLLMGASLSLSTYFYALTEWVDVGELSGLNISSFLGVVLPNLMVIFALTFFYIFVPNRTISWRHGLIGGAVAGILFAILKKLFGLYVSSFPSYQAIYGVLATIPIFLIWMYLAWSVVLMGALLTAALEDWKHKSHQQDAYVTPGEKMAAAFVALRLLKKQHTNGGVLDGAVIKQELGAAVAAEVLQALEEAGFAVQSEEDKWVLARDLTQTDVAELHKILGLDLGSADFGQSRAAEAINQAEAARIEAMRAKLADILST